MSLRVILGLVVLCAAHRAVAERAVRLVLAPEVPFAAAELEAALRLRLPDGPPVAIAIDPIAGGVRVTVAAAARDVPLDGLRGAEAARLVALATADLFDDQLARAPDAPLAAPALTAPRPVSRRAGAAIELLGSAAAWDHVLAAGAIGIVVPRGPWVATVEVSGGGLIGGQVGMLGGAIRLGGGRRLGWVDLRAELVAAPIAVSTGAGDHTALLGAGASARLRVPVTARVRGVVAVGLDAFATRSEYQLMGSPVMATPWAAPWLAAGVEVAP